MTDTTNPRPDRRARYAAAIRVAGDTAYGNGPFYEAITTAVIAVADAEQAELRTANERMRHELEVMYGGAFDSLPDAAVPVPASAPTDQAALRDRIADALHSTYGQEDTHRSLAIADAVLAVLPAPDDPDGLLAKVDEATATLRRIRSTIRTLRDQGATGQAYYQAITGDLAGPRPDHVVPVSGPGDATDETQGTDDCCGAEPTPADWVGDCWCTLPPGHPGEHRCQPCTDRHGAPGWTEQPAVVSQPDGEATAAVYLSSRCDACRHTLNWHRNDVGCTVALCVCGRFQAPAAEDPAP